MTFKDIAKQLSTAVQTVPNLVQILREGFEQVAAGSSDAYSGTEAAVGTWSDGATLYRKNFSFSGVFLTSGQRAKIGEFSEAISLKIAIGTCTEGSTTVTLPERSMSVQYASNELRLAASDSWSNISGEIVAYYTKPTV